MAFHGLLGPVGVRQQGPAHADEIRLAAGEDLLGIIRLGDGAGGEHRDADFLLDGLGRPDVVAARELHGRDLVDHLVVVAAADVNGRAAQLLQALGIIDGILDGHAARLVIRAAQAHDDGEVLAHVLLAALENLLQEAEAVLPAAAVPVAPLVGEGREEVGDEVAVRAVDLHHLEAGGLCTPCGLAEILHQLVDLLDGQLFRDGGLAVALIHQRPGIGRGGFHRRAQKALASAVLDLDAGHAVEVLDGIGQPAQAHDVFIITDAQLVGGGLAALAVHVGVFHDDHAHFAARQVLIAADQPGGDGAVHVAQPRGLGRFADAVFDDDVADLAGAEKRGIVGIHDRRSFRIQFAGYDYKDFFPAIPIALTMILMKIIVSHDTDFPPAGLARRFGCIPLRDSV